MEEPGRLQSTGLKRVRHDWVTKQQEQGQREERSPSGGSSSLAGIHQARGAAGIIIHREKESGSVWGKREKISHNMMAMWVPGKESVAYTPISVLFALLCAPSAGGKSNC